MKRPNEASGGLPPGLATARALDSPSTGTFCVGRRKAGVMKLEVNLKASDGSSTFWQAETWQKMSQSAQLALNLQWKNAVALRCVDPATWNSLSLDVILQSRGWPSWYSLGLHWFSMEITVQAALFCTRLPLFVSSWHGVTRPSEADQAQTFCMH